MKVVIFFVSVLMFLYLYSLAYGEIDKTMVLALSLDDVSGNITRDSSLYGLDAKVSGPKLVDGKFGKALEFNGEKDFVQVPDDKNLLLLNGGTLMVWAYIKTTSGHASWPRIMIKSNTNGGTNGYDFLFDRANGYAVRFCVGGACNSYTPVPTDSWHHIAVTFDGKEINVYVDGAKTGNLTQPGSAIDTSGSPLNIGNGIAQDRPFQGIYDEIRIFNRALKQDEIKYQMSRGTRDIVSVEPKYKLVSTWSAIKNEY